MGKRRRQRDKDEGRDEQPSKPLTDEVRAQIDAWAEEAAEVHDLMLHEVEITSLWKIQVFVDRPRAQPGEGVTIEACADVSRYVEAYLDADERVPERYTIEVSSPGIERKLKKPRHLALAVGQQVRVVTKEPIAGDNVIVGELTAFEDDVLTVHTMDADEVQIPWSNVTRAKTEFEF